MFSDVERSLLSAGTAPGGIPGWETLSTHDYWVYRPLPKATKLPYLDRIAPGARALTFFADIDKKQSHIQVYTSDKSENTMPDGLPASKWAQYHRMDPGIWEATIPLDQAATSVGALYEIIAYFGFGVVL